MNHNKSYKPTTLILYAAFLMNTIVACNDTNDIDDLFDWPAEFADVRVDFIDSGSAEFLADLTGNTSEIRLAGFALSQNTAPTMQDNTVGFSPEPGIHEYRFSGLQAGQTYYMRAYYTYKDSVFYSPQVSFTTPSPVTDHEGNNYPVVQIGNQLWMSKNLMVKTFTNGEGINDGTGSGNYTDLESPRFYFHYNDDPGNTSTYGNLYTWYVAIDNRGICPAGWRVPDIQDWENLTLHLDPLGTAYQDLVPGNHELSSVAGGMLRTTGTIEQGNGLWYHPNSGATNQTAAHIVPSGLRDPSGVFDGLGYNAAFWSYTELNLDNGIMIYTHFFNPGLHANSFSKKTGYAIRCMTNAD